MSTKVKIRHIRALDLELVEKGIRVWVNRLTVQVCFRTRDGWTQPYEAIVDTGAPVSIIPPPISEEIDKNVLGDHAISGIVPHEGAVLPVKVADVWCAVLDEKRMGKSLKIRAYLATDQRVPLILGFENLLSEAILHCDCKRNEMFIEM